MKMKKIGGDASLDKPKRCGVIIESAGSRRFVDFPLAFSL